MNHELRSKSVSTKVSEGELRVLELRAALAGVTLSEWVRNVLLASSVGASAMAAERAILAEVLGMQVTPAVTCPVADSTAEELFATLDDEANEEEQR